jgi:hypothetical protein
MADLLDAVVHRALEYPYAAPPHSYLYDASAPNRCRALPLDSKQWERRTPVLAAGSNRAPERLAQKFQRAFPDALIPVTQAHLTDFDSVYCAHVTSYGSVPATLHPSPGTTLTLHITWLTDDELACMHDTEQPGVNYHFARMTGLKLAVEDGTRLDAAYAYLSAHGALIEDGAPVALAALSATGRRFPVRTQSAMLAGVSARVAPGVDVHDFIRGVVGIEADRCALRARHETLLRRSVALFPFETVEIVPVG